jgi:hypothetical protein
VPGFTFGPRRQCGGAWWPMAGPALACPTWLGWRPEGGRRPASRGASGLPANRVGVVERNVERRRTGPGVWQPRGSARDGRWSGVAARMRDGTREGARGLVQRKKMGRAQRKQRNFQFIQKNFKRNFLDLVKR